MSSFQRNVPFLYKLFMKIAEPRVVRLIHFGVYAALLWAGLAVFTNPPESFKMILDPARVFALGAFLSLGSLMAFIAVLPGIWWLERIGLIGMGAGMGIYIVIVIDLGSSPLGLGVTFAFLLFFLRRWLEIKGSQLAPTRRE